MQTTIIGVLLWTTSLVLALRLSNEDVRKSPAGEHVKCGYKVRYNTLARSASFWQTTYPEWEGDTFAVFDSIVPKDAVVLDVGACWGQTTLWLAQKAKHIVALEPSRAYEELMQNLDANKDSAWTSRVTALNLAMGDTDEGKIISNGGGSNDRIYSAGHIPTGYEEMTTTSIQSITIESLMMKHPILQQTGFVKVDTEGHERIIIPAMREFFKQVRPILFLSIHPMFLESEQVKAVLKELTSTFPYVYETDMQTLIDPDEVKFDKDHQLEVVATWAPIQKENISQRCLLEAEAAVRPSHQAYELGTKLSRNTELGQWLFDAIENLRVEEREAQYQAIKDASDKLGNMDIADPHEYFKQLTGLTRNSD